MLRYMSSARIDAVTVVAAASVIVVATTVLLETGVA